MRLCSKTPTYSAWCEALSSKSFPAAASNSAPRRCCSFQIISLKRMSGEKKTKPKRMCAAALLTISL